MEIEQLGKIDVRDAVAPGQHESAIAEIGRQALDPAAGQSVIAGVDKMNLPVGGRIPVIMRQDRPFIEIYRYVTCKMTIIDHVFLDIFALISKSYEKFWAEIPSIMRHYVPQYRPTAYFNHGLWLGLGLLGETAPDTAGQNRNFQRLHLLFPQNY
jgi:hypothetical protein